VKLTPKGARIFSQPNMKKSNSQKKKKKKEANMATKGS
jgi:hypothetical protein